MLRKITKPLQVVDATAVRELMHPKKHLSALTLHFFEFTRRT